jgi:hypothetical protein
MITLADFKDAPSLLNVCCLPKTKEASTRKKINQVTLPKERGGTVDNNYKK